MNNEQTLGHCSLLLIDNSLINNELNKLYSATRFTLDTESSTRKRYAASSTSNDEYYLEEYKE